MSYGLRSRDSRGIGGISLKSRLVGLQAFDEDGGGAPPGPNFLIDNNLMGPLNESNGAILVSDNNTV